MPRLAALRARHLLAAVASLAVASPAAADTLHATRGRITELTHTVDVILGRGHGHLTVVRELHNHGERHDQAILHLNLPGGAVATGLRTRAITNGVPVWFKGELLDAEVAAARYHELTGLGGYYPKDPALLSWRSQDHLALQVFPCPPQEDKGIGYELEMPTAWVEGREQLELPAMGVDGAAAIVNLRTDVPGARLFVDGREVPSGTKLPLDEPHAFQLEPPMRFDAVDGRLAAVSFAKARNLVAVRFEAPRQLSEVPRGAHVVIAIDTSRSVDEDRLAASMRAANATLAHFEGRDGRVAVVGFDRTAHDLTSGFVGLDAARALLDGPPPARGNGSAVDVAIARAAQLFASAPPGAPRRLVVLHDRLARQGLDPKKLARPAGAVVHVANVTSGDASTRRDDDDPWATLPRATGGLFFTAVAPPTPLSQASDRTEIEQAFLEWARPVRIDHLAWRMAGVDESVLLDHGDELEEGDSIEHRAIQPILPSNAVLQGELWSRPYKATVGASREEAQRWSALVFGTELLHELSEPEMTVLAFAGGAVSPMTSYLAIEPGVRPSTEGLEEGEGGGGMGFGTGMGRLGSVSLFGGGAGASPPDYAGILRGLVAAGVQRCGATGRTRIDAEATYAEVVDVAVVVSGDDRARTAGRCVEEVAWAAELPQVFRIERQTLHVQL